MVMQMISPFLSAYLFALWLKLESDQELWHCKSMLLKRSHHIVYFCIPKLKIMLHSSSTSFVYFWFDLILANVKLGCHLYSRIYKRMIHISFLIFFLLGNRALGRISEEMKKQVERENLCDLLSMLQVLLMLWNICSFASGIKLLNVSNAWIFGAVGPLGVYSRLLYLISV